MIDSCSRLLWRHSLTATVWIASLILGIALVTGVLGGTRVSAAHTPPARFTAPTVRTLRGAVPAVHGRLLQQRIGGTPMSPQ
jgi:hypothetical protein